MFRGTLIRSGGNAKTIKGDKGGLYETAIMYLAPHIQSGLGNVCPMAETAGCIKGCLFTAGRAGVMPNINKARIAKTRRYFADRRAFMVALANDIAGFVRYCERKGVKPAVRLNGTSDIQWEIAHPVPFGGWSRFVPLGSGWNNGDAPSIFAVFPQVQFYDYTKVYKRAYRELPTNYSLTLSYSAASQTYADAVLTTADITGANLAVVYRSKAVRDHDMARGKSNRFSWIGREVIDGDETDMRFTDPRGVIVGLYAKGAAKRDTSGFVVG